MRTGGSPARCHAIDWLHAARRTQMPIGRMRPVSSATGMNLVGVTGPSSALFHRSSASTPAIPFVTRSSFAW